MKELIKQEEWKYLKEFMPKHKPIGRPRVDDKKLLNGIVFVLRTGCRWEDMPKEYGNCKTAHNLSVIYEVSNRRRFQELEKINFFEKININLIGKHESKVELKKNND